MIFRSPEPPLTIPEVALTDFLIDRVAARGDHAAFIDGPTGRTITCDAWARSVRAVAAGLAKRGFRKGDVFAIYSPNVPEYAIAFHAVALAGGIVTTINPLYTVGETASQLKDAGARFLMTVPPFLERAREAAASSAIEEVFVFGEAEEATPFASLAAAGDPPAIAIDAIDDVVVLPYSSGTTGLPKGVMLTHHNLVANIVQTHAVLRLDETDTVLGLLPFFHIYGMVVIMNLALHSGATVVTMPRFDLEQFLETLEKYRITFANVVPPIVLALAKSPAVEGRDLSALRMLFSGAAPLSASLAEAAAARLGCEVVQGYGLTETSPVTHAMRTDAPVRKHASIGPPIPNTEVKVVDLATGSELEAMQEGEICIRGPQVMKGYLGRPRETADMLDPDGWLHTGDIGHADGEGDFFIVDRVKELIKYKGLQVAPAELEAVLLGHPAVADAAVVPLPDEEAGQIPKAFVVLKGEATPEEIMSFVAERVAPYKRIRACAVIDAIPKSASGKILRRMLV